VGPQRPRTGPDRGDPGRVRPPPSPTSGCRRGGHRQRRRCPRLARRPGRQVRSRRSPSRSGEDPQVGVALVVEQLAGRTRAPARCGRLRAVGRSARCSGGLEREIATDRPGAASCGRVAPLIARTTAMAFGRRARVPRAAPR
jgi:hypothetical protein